MQAKISPSVLAADFANIQSEIEMLNESEADLVHIDIMDGSFVPNISFGFPVCSAINKHCNKPLDYHLMIQKPENYLGQCKKNGAEIISVHYEACDHLHRVVQQIKELGCQASVAINPHTSVELLLDIIPFIDIVLVMSVNPGFGGQKFIPQTVDKVRRLKKLIEKTNPKCQIEIDGGVTMDNADQLISAGADILVAGSFVFNSTDPKGTIKRLKAL
ncbi:MAG: ribulose-phosphate 3-epimerase [Cyclobacteriaceae bacterium]